LITADQARAQRGRRVELILTDAGGGSRLTGRISAYLESADGLVIYLTDDAGASHTVHYQHVAQLRPLD
jgi:tryptophan synthase beta subunit